KAPQFPIESKRRQFTAPKAAGIDTVNAIVCMKPERRPVTENESIVGAFPPRHLEPRHQMRRLCARGTFFFEIGASVAIAVPDSGKTIGAETQPLPTLQSFRPKIGLIAVHMPEQLDEILALKTVLHLPGMALGIPGAPLWRQAGVNQVKSILPMQQRAMA